MKMKENTSRLAWLTFKGLLLGMLFFALLLSRRWQQLLSPQVWDEDGSQILPMYIAKGWQTFIVPVNGYLITIPKMISALSVEFSFYNYPLFSTLLCWLFTVFVALTIAYAPTKLKYRKLCATAVFLIPTDPEVFGIPLYSFWFASLLLFLLALWDERYPFTLFRSAFALLCGLSTPVIAAMLPLLYLRSYLYRKHRSEHITAVTATVATVVQLSYMLGKNCSTATPPFKDIICSIIPKFFGIFLIGNWLDNVILLWLSGLLIIMLLFYWLIRKRGDASYLCLLYLLIATISLSVARVNPKIIHPILAGPRYFYFPFVIIFWLLLQCYWYSRKKYWLCGIAIIFILLGVTNAIPAWTRCSPHDDLSWKKHLRLCYVWPKTYNIPIHYNGRLSEAWHLPLSGEQCRQLLDNDYFFKPADQEITLPPYAVNKHKKVTTPQIRESAILLSSTINGKDFHHSTLLGYKIIGSYNKSDSDIGQIELRLKKGRELLYRSGPDNSGLSIKIGGYEHAFTSSLPVANDWVFLEFDHPALPPNFTILLEDRGTNWGQWFAVAYAIYAEEEKPNENPHDPALN